MPEGLVRKDLNTTGIDYRNGTPVTLPHDFGNDVTWLPSPAHFGNTVTWVPSPAHFGNPMTWVPSPAHFGNLINGNGSEDDLLQEDGTSTFIRENSSGNILLET